jgi:hypothetical protein
MIAKEAINSDLIESLTLDSLDPLAMQLEAISQVESVSAERRAHQLDVNYYSTKMKGSRAECVFRQINDMMIFHFFIAFHFRVERQSREVKCAIGCCIYRETVEKPEKVSVVVWCNYISE